MTVEMTALPEWATALALLSQEIRGWLDWLSKRRKRGKH